MDHLIALILVYKYAILIPIAILEGPIAAVIAGFLSSSGVLNAFLVFVILVMGDVIGDGFAYVLGRWCSGFVRRHGHRIGLTKAKLDAAQTYFHANGKKALFLSKVIHGVGFAGLIVAGNLKISYRRFFLTCVSVSIVQSSILLTVGFLFGHAYTLIGTYLDYYAAAGVVLVVCAIIFFIVKKKMGKKKGAKK